MAPQRWTDEMLDRQAEQIADDRARMAERSREIEALLEGQRMLVQIYQQEHEARVEADRRFNRFIEEQQRINQRLEAAIERLDATIERLERIITFRSDNGNLG